MPRIRFAPLVTLVSFLVVPSLTVLSPALADVETDLSGNIRIRYEGDDRRFMTTDTDVRHIVLQRTRVQFVARKEGAEFVIQLQDARRWGEEQFTIANTQNVDLHRGYLKLKGDAGELILGRQELIYGVERVVGALAWLNNARSFDAVRARAKRNAHWLDLFAAAIAVERLINPEEFPDRDEEFLGAVGHLEARRVKLEFEPMVLYRSRTPTAHYLTSIGNYARFRHDWLVVDQDFVYQTGRREGADVEAWLGAIDARVNIPVGGGSLSPAAGVSFYTGNDPSEAKWTAYDFLYPTNHKFYGYMDLSFLIAGRRGLLDEHLKVFVKRGSLSGVVAFHHFDTDVEVTLSDGGKSKSIGNELDAVLRQPLSSHFTIEVGGGVFEPGDVTKDERGDRTVVWGYLQGTGKF